MQALIEDRSHEMQIWGQDCQMQIGIEDGDQGQSGAWESQIPH